MKRLNYLYKNIYNIKNITLTFNEICKNTRNKKKVELLKECKSTYISNIYYILMNKIYSTDSYNKFVIYEPKERLIVSQNMKDKIVNHLVARYILYPAILPCLLDINVASRKGMGTSKGIEYLIKYDNKCKIKYNDYYVLKCDISKFFASIDHNILLKKIERRIKDKDALKIVSDIIDSNTNGLFIGSMTSQVLAIFYLNDMDHFIKEKLKIKYYIRYQDDFLLFHESKDYLKYCLEQIKNFLENEKLTLNKKTRIFKCTNNFSFLGRNRKGNYIRCKNIKRKIKLRYNKYHKELISLNSIASSIICYKSLSKKYKKN